MHARRDTSLATDQHLADLLSRRLLHLADRLAAGASLNPTVLLCIRNSDFSEQTRLAYRAEWVARLIQLRRDSIRPQVLHWMEAAHALIVARQSNLPPAYLQRNLALSKQLATSLRRLQPGWVRLSHYCSRRTGPDTALLAVEFFAEGLASAIITGSEDYHAALYCVCRQPSLRFRLNSAAIPRLHTLAADWRAAAGI